MKPEIALREVDSVEIVTLQDNYIDAMAGDNTDIVSRASALKNGETCKSIQAEHGFSALARTRKGAGGAVRLRPRRHHQHD